MKRHEETPQQVKHVSFHEITPNKLDDENVVKMEKSDDEEIDLFITKSNEILESDTSSEESEFSEVFEVKKP